MAKMSKAQARKRLQECRAKLNNVLLADMISFEHYAKITATISKALNSTRLK